MHITLYVVIYGAGVALFYTISGILAEVYIFLLSSRDNGNITGVTSVHKAKVFSDLMNHMPTLLIF